ncbi:MAG TPA: GAF domain-containing sensor histidine kinase [Marmoricola sp.]|nr:GAF domain-containing sensor histidine kinase [Marmoricola sp.]
MAQQPSSSFPALAGDAQALVDALVAISSDLDLDSVLDRLVAAACELTQARYGALGVLGVHETVTRLVTFGMTPEQIRALGPLPTGHGVVGVLISDPRPLRLARIQDHPESVGFPPGHPPMKTFLGVPVRVRGTVFGNLYLTEKAGGAEFTDQDQRFVEVLATAAAHVIENARSYAQSEQRRLWLEAAAQVRDLLQPPADVDAALTQIAISARRLAAAGGAAVVRCREGSTEVVARDGVDLGLLDEAALVLADEVRAAIDQHEPRVADAEGHPVLLVPLREQFGPGGALLVHAPGTPDHLDIELLGAFADQAALALDHATALADREELLLTADRDRIARDLHDLVIQRLFATGLQLQGTRRRAIKDDVQIRIEQAITDLDVTIKDIRSTIFDLQHGRGDSLRAEVRRVTREYTTVLGHEPVLRTDGPLDTGVPPEVAEHAVAVLREALSNVARHAQSAQTIVELTLADGELALAVTDDGRGLPTERSESGMRNVRRRAVDLGGTVAYDSPGGRGTRMEWRVPVLAGS